MNHKIKLRLEHRTNVVCCPYQKDGLCYRKGCIHLPHYNCMSKGEYDHLIAIYNRYRQSKKSKFRKVGKKDER